jgi:riboflavin synthase
MFTGLIRTRGRIERIDQQGDVVMRIAAFEALPLSLGASIACNGICLTVIEINGKNFSVSLSAETLRCSTAKDWRVGDVVNLEPSLAVGDVLGGHFVAGHVDAVATAISAETVGDSVVWAFEVPSEFSKFIAPKGSVTLDGVSLTVNEVSGQRFTVNIIPHTQEATGFGALSVGSAVNLEIDLLARYVARLKDCA